MAGREGPPFSFEDRRCEAVIGVGRVNRQEAERRFKEVPEGDAAAIFAAGLDLLDADQPEALFPRVRKMAERHGSDHRIQQLLGLTARALGESGQALAAFARAAALAPADPLIAHSHARAALEAGRDASFLFDRAAQLAPNDGSVLQGRAAALHAKGKTAEAIEQLTALIGRNPLWIEGHRTLAHLRGQLGLDPATAIQDAIAEHPLHPVLHQMLIATRLEARDHDGAATAVAAADRIFGETNWLFQLAAHVASERGEIARADTYFGKCALKGIDEVGSWVRHLIRAGRPEALEPAVAPWAENDRDNILWPYRALAWRMLADPRAAWLEGDRRLIGVYDLADDIRDLAGLAVHLRRLHVASHAPLDQSVRGGTQTDGNLLVRDEAPIRALRTLILQRVREHIAQLPPAIDGHPTLLRRRDPLRIAGSWSVRLCNEGFHSDHIHSQGWISSALYISLPGATPDGDAPDRHAGWLSLGECRELVPGLTPFRLVEPRLGRLVLFPSTMWHGTRAFPAGERLTIAFDIARPQQG